MEIKENTKKHHELVKFAIDTALKNGCTQVRASLGRTAQSSYSIRDGKMDRLQSSTGASLFIQLFANERFGSFSTNRTEKTELENFIKRGVEAIGYLEKDPCRALPAPELYYRHDKVALKQTDPEFEKIHDESKMKIAFDCSDEILGSERRLISANCEYGETSDYYVMADSQGFAGESEQTLFSLSAECTVKGRGDARPEAWWYEASMFFDSLIKRDVGKTALARAIARLNPKKLRSGRYNMVVENSVSSRLIAPVISALNGASLQQNNSFLKDSLGKKIFAGNMNFIDDAHNPGAMGARYFDSEGIATKPHNIITAGVVSTYYISSYFSRKLSVPVTSEGPSVPLLKGELSLEEILSLCGTGIYVTGFNGGNTNSSTGDFSFGVEGFWFENGKIIHPVKEMNITGNMIELWNNLMATGKDPRLSGRWQIPTIAFGSVSFSGI
jgi:PmbA protein